MVTVMQPQFLQANVMHQRLTPKRHGFQYHAYYVHLPLEQLDQVKEMAIDRYGMVSFFRKDHGYRDGRSLRQWAHDQLAEQGLPPPVRISLLTLPRLLGYVFNPVSFWFCYDTDDEIRAVLCEVNNTFGGSHTYLCRHDDGRAITAQCWLERPKRLYVSPFYAVEGHYSFRFHVTRQQCRIQIRYHDAARQRTLLTSLGGAFAPLSQHRKILWRTPLLSLKVIALIHYQAVRLLLKGMRFRPQK